MILWIAFVINNCVALLTMQLHKLRNRTILRLFVIMNRIHGRLAVRDVLLKIFLLENACVMVVVPKIDKSSLLFKIGWASADNVNFLTKPHFIYSAVARGGAGGARSPPVFFLKSKNRPV